MSKFTTTMFLAASSSAALMGCGAGVKGTEMIRNDVTVSSDLNGDPLVDAAGDPVELRLTVQSLQVRFRAEETVEPGDPPDGEFPSSVLSATLMPDGEASVSSLDCGIYDVRITDDMDRTCEFVATADNPAGGLYLCFVEGVWPLANHVNEGTCTDLFPETIPPE